jgi:hypothetical protein
MHLQHPTDTLTLALDRIEDRVAAFQHTGIDPNKAQRADKRIGHDLEGQRGKRLVITGFADDLFFRVGHDTCDRG